MCRHGWYRSNARAAVTAALVEVIEAEARVLEQHQIESHGMTHGLPDRCTFDPSLDTRRLLDEVRAVRSGRRTVSA